jgi:hypothetical protein
MDEVYTLLRSSGRKICGLIPQKAYPLLMEG